MKTSTKAITPLVLAMAMLLALVGASACTADDPAESETTAPSGAEPDPIDTPSEPEISPGSLTLVSNTGTRQTPVGWDQPDLRWYNTESWISADGSIVFHTAAKVNEDLQFTYQQIYRWTPEFGLNLITNVSTDPDTPIGADGYSAVTDVNDDGSIVFLSNAPDLPGGNGNIQTYLWTNADGLTLVHDAGSWAYGLLSFSDNGPWYPFYECLPKLNSDESIVFCQASHTEDPSTGNYVTTYHVYRWTRGNGLTLLGEIPLDLTALTSKFGDIPLIGNDGSLVFNSNAPDLPGSNGRAQVYLWNATDGVTLISNAGTSQNPLGGNAHSEVRVVDAGTVLLRTAATNLPGGVGTPSDNQYALFTSYLWTEKDGLVLIVNNDTAWYPAVSASGFVAFESRDPADEPPYDSTRAYFWTAQDGLTLITNIGTDGSFEDPQVSRDGHVVFTSATNHLPGANGNAQAYLWTAQDGLTLISNVGTAEAPIGANAPCSSPQINANGSVTFWSDATDLPGSNGSQQLYLWTPPQK
jgi:hypothetical protein